MPKSKKLKFKGVNNKTSFGEAAKIILINRSNNVKRNIKEFLNDPGVETLHEVRIAIRRLRYNMEVFSSCLDKKKFEIFYKVVQHLQDLTGQKRDLDVLLNYMKNLSAQKGIKVGEDIFINFEEQQNLINDTLKLELFQYLHSNNLKAFEKMLN